MASNYRGCGKSEGTDAFGGDDVHDVIHLLDLCEKLNSVDTKNINMFGVSRGGMMTYETLREDRRIHKAVVVAGVADCTMNYEEREDMRSLLTELIGGTPEQLPEEYSRRSAVAWADEINTPLLIFHTTGDDKVSIKQADKLVKQTWIGAGATVKNNISIASGCMIGAGAVVVKKIDSVTLPTQKYFF